jgi:predicted  nucleic acid-binding Zn-ribbon protein
MATRATVQTTNTHTITKPLAPHIAAFINPTALSKTSEPATISSDNETSSVSAPLETKEQLVSKIRDWVKNDNEIRALQKEMNKRKQDKKLISKELLEVMRKNDIDAFDLKDGQLVYAKTKTKKPITKKTLFGLLSTYFKGNTEKASELNEFIMERREEVIHEKLVRKFHKEDA